MVPVLDDKGSQKHVTAHKDDDRYRAVSIQVRFRFNASSVLAAKTLSPFLEHVSVPVRRSYCTIAHTRATMPSQPRYYRVISMLVCKPSEGEARRRDDTCIVSVQKPLDATRRRWSRLFMQKNQSVLGPTNGREFNVPAKVELFVPLPRKIVFARRTGWEEKFVRGYHRWILHVRFEGKTFPRNYRSQCSGSLEKCQKDFLIIQHCKSMRLNSDFIVLDVDISIYVMFIFRTMLTVSFIIWLFWFTLFRLQIW